MGCIDLIHRQYAYGDRHSVTDLHKHKQIRSFQAAIDAYTQALEVDPGKYRMIFDTDADKYGGHGRLVQGQAHYTQERKENGAVRHFLSLYLPTRTAIVLHPVV